MSVRISSVLLCLVLAAPLFAAEPWEGTYAYDGAGNIKAIGANRYVYDGVGRLIEATDPQNAARSFFYDAFGNLREVRTNHDAAHPKIIGADSLTNRMTDASRCFEGSTCVVGQYDPEGHQIVGSDNSQYGYDAVDMMTTLDNGSRQEVYIYDAQDQRIATVVNAAAPAPTWRYTLRGPGASVIREWTSTGASWAWTKDYVHRDGVLLASIANVAGTEQRTHFHVDHLGSPRLLTDDEGRKVAVHTYWPFGLEAAGSDTDAERMKYTSHERDFAGAGDINDLDYMHARYYSPVAGRFLSVDPGGMDASRPQSWNRYAYASNNPINRLDPDGKEDTWAQRAAAKMAAAGQGIKAFGASLSNGSVAGTIADATLGTLGDVVGGSGDMLNVGTATGEVIGSGGDAHDMAMAVSQDVGRGSALVLTLAAPVSGVGRGSSTSTLAARVEQAHGALDPIAQSMRTTGGLRTSAGDMIAGGARDLTPAQRSIVAQNGGIPVRLPGAHAEPALLNAARNAGARPQFMFTTRTICPSCQAAIEKSGGTVTSTTTAIWPK